MAVGEEASLWPTENLLVKEGRKHYRTSVSPIAERQDVIYFPTGVNNTHITRLNTTTLECETIKVISFHPRCLVAKDGWICCGGENGEFVVIRESGRNDANEALSSDNLRSTMNSSETNSMAEGSMSQLQRDMLSLVERINGSNKTWSASSHKIGTERVNCVTIWNPPNVVPKPGQYDSPVAILANNDKTITIVGLLKPDSPPIDELTYPDCVNRGVMSPDGSLLAAICDDPYLYIHARVPATNTYRSSPSFTHTWEELPRIRLKGQWNLDPTDCRGSFAACFSSSGKYLAVGTQYGTISVFDAGALKDPESEPLITYFDSDRAPGEYGAVRDMAFSPGSHDLLAWSEHRGRIGIADARTNFTRRQIISLDNPDAFDHLSLNDRSTINPRLLDPRNERNDRNERNERIAGSERSARAPLSTADYLAQSRSGRPLPNPESSDDTSRLNQPFSADEVATLEAIQNERRRRERGGGGGQRDRVEPDPLDPWVSDYQNRVPPGGSSSTTWRVPALAERVSGMSIQDPPRDPTEPRPVRPVPESAPRSRHRLSRSQTMIVLDMIFERLPIRHVASSSNQVEDPLREVGALPEIAANDEQREALARILEREHIREVREQREQRRPGTSQTPPEQDRERRAPTPRRRSSIMQALSQNADIIPPIVANNRQQGQGNESENAMPSRERDSLWNTDRIVAGMSEYQALNRYAESNRNSRPDSRFRRGFLSDLWGGDDPLPSRNRMGSREHQQHADDTAGLAWSEDGRTLYIGAEDGIYEFHINMHSRMLFPDISLR
ncbi:hypothetical protein GGR54DRAFT_643200 [Hypoxylon sp. NC1633]|nr:hypothetical protein GGR54DRAFT_643200 [Hypoxylon sp. NC1633]